MQVDEHWRIKPTTLNFTLLQFQKRIETLSQLQSYSIASDTLLKKITSSQITPGPFPLMNLESNESARLWAMTLSRRRSQDPVLLVAWTCLARVARLKKHLRILGNSWIWIYIIHFTFSKNMCMSHNSVFSPHKRICSPLQKTGPSMPCIPCAADSGR